MKDTIYEMMRNADNVLPEYGKEIFQIACACLNRVGTYCDDITFIEYLQTKINVFCSSFDFSYKFAVNKNSGRYAKKTVDVLVKYKNNNDTSQPYIIQFPYYIYDTNDIYYEELWNNKRQSLSDVLDNEYITSFAILSKDNNNKLNQFNTNAKCWN